MEFQPGTITLNAISGGVLTAGTVPFQRFQRFFNQVENPAQVVCTAANTQLNYMETTGSILGDYILAWARIQGTKGFVQGRCHHRIERSVGPGQVDWLIRGPMLEEVEPDIPANEQWASVHFALGIVTTAGAMRLRTQASSIGSDFTVGAASAGLSVWIIPGS